MEHPSEGINGYTGGEKYIDLNILNKDKSIEDLIIP